MIHATSLRLGNLILEAGEIKKVYQLSIGGKTYDSINDIKVNRETVLTESGEDRFMPIPLTPEWLEQMGFIRDAEQQLAPVSTAYTLTLNVGGGNRNEICAFLLSDEHKIKPDMRSFAGAAVNDHHASNNYYFVHEIQNAVRALTGEELVIKTTKV